MDSRLIHKTSEKQKHKIDWIKPTETEWLYCGAKGEVKFDVIKEHVDAFFTSKKLYVSTTRTASFATAVELLTDSISDKVGVIDFHVWAEDFQSVIEFNKIGVFRKGKYHPHINLPTNKISYNKIKPTSPDKVRGTLVRYRKGDCLSLAFESGKHLAVFISEKFNKFYDLTPIAYLGDKKPTMQDFLSGKFFGKYMDTTNGIIVTTERHMIPCFDVDANQNIERIGSVDVVEHLEKASYRYIKSIEELFDYYIEDIPLRTKRTKNFDQHPDKLFISDRLIDMKQILKGETLV